MRGTIHSRRSSAVPVPVDDLWATLAAVDRYQDWWPWLVRFEAGALAPGATWRCTVRAPLRYRVSFDLALTEVRPGERVTAAVRGDITGRAELRVGATGPTTSHLHLESWLAPSARWLRGLATAARPVTTRGHHWILDTGLRQFRQRALG